MKKRLRDVLSGKGLTCIYNSYDVIGDIAIIRVPNKSRQHRRIIAEAILNTHKNVKTVLAQTDRVGGVFRLRRLAFVAGEDKVVTVHREYGCAFSVDVEKCYFSPRLLYERMRIAKQVGDGEVVANMFAGVGSFSIVIAKHSKIGKIYSIDINPVAFRFMQENVRLNRVCGKVFPMQGDAEGVIQERLRRVADRVLMPLPEKAFEYLPSALLALKKAGGWVHYYGFEHAKKEVDPTQKAKLKVTEKLESLGASFKFPFCRVVRSTGPNWYQVVLDIKVNFHGNQRTGNG